MSTQSPAAPRLLGVGLISGWGRGVDALPENAKAAAGGRRVISAGRPSLSGERFRRATRECVLGVTAVEELLQKAGVSRSALAGERTALLYVTASAYGASNRAFIEGGGTTTLHFPYTAPSAVPAEVTIEFGITGPYVIFIGGATATLSALWCAATQLASSLCDRALVLAVETFEECADLYARGRWLVDAPLVEAAACALLEGGAGTPRYSERRRSEIARVSSSIRDRLGETFSCEPLVELAALASHGEPLNFALTGRWRGAEAHLSWSGSAS